MTSGEYLRYSLGGETAIERGAVNVLNIRWRTRARQRMCFYIQASVSWVESLRGFRPNSTDLLMKTDYAASVFTQLQSISIPQERGPQRNSGVKSPQGKNPRSVEFQLDLGALIER
jgi:hypothetical protein